MYLPGNPSTPLPVGLVFATKFWLYYTVFTVAFPGEPALALPLPPHLSLLPLPPAGLVHRPVLFFLINAAMLYCYWRTVYADPGFIPKALSPQAARLVSGGGAGGGAAAVTAAVPCPLQTILQLCEQGVFDSSQFCSTCLVSACRV